MSDAPPPAGSLALLSDEGREFVTARGLASLTTLRSDGSPHVTPVGYTVADGPDGTTLVRVICSGTSQKAANARRTGLAAVCQVDGARWLTFEGHAVVTDDPQRVAEAVARYAARYRPPRANPARVAVEITVTRVLGSPALRAGAAG